MIKPMSDADGVVIYEGEALRLLHNLNLNGVGAVITDPPYSSGGMFRGDRVQKVQDKYLTKVDVPGFTGDNRDARSYLAWTSLWLSACWEACDDGAFVFVFCDWRQLPTVTDAIQSGGFIWRGVITWSKNTGRPQRGRFRQDSEFIVWGTKGVHRSSAAGISPSSVQYCPSVPSSDRLHMTEKPLPLLASLISLLPPNSLVLDPFMGCGSTVIAARDAGHRVVGFELDPVFAGKAAQRIKQRPLLVPPPLVEQPEPGWLFTDPERPESEGPST